MAFSSFDIVGYLSALPLDRQKYRGCHLRYSIDVSWDFRNPLYKQLKNRTLEMRG